MEGADPPHRILDRTGLMASELTLTLTSDGDSSRFDEQEETSNLGESQARESTPTEWTDEKHSLYLKSMEASFVDQLYSSFGLLRWSPQRNSSLDPQSSRQMHASNCVPSGQYKVLQDGCWAKINFRRDESQLNKADGPGVLLANPWIRHFRSGCRPMVKTSASRKKPALATASNRFPGSQSHLCGHDSIGSSAEVSDQNFVNADAEKENSSVMSIAKRMKATVVASSSNDQVVPLVSFLNQRMLGGIVFPQKSSAFLLW
ncbi:unnamed protein product [Ilex paraguariensis]|uniref:Cold regulated protein 27 n=1 Tax=Ilex paraguariensis TaxID=185542 RepID=A0ABC8QZR2_9AQUA